MSLNKKKLYFKALREIESRFKIVYTFFDTSCIANQTRGFHSLKLLLYINLILTYFYTICPSLPTFILVYLGLSFI